MYRIKIFSLIVFFALTLRMTQFVPSLVVLKELWIVLLLLLCLIGMVIYLMLKRQGFKFTAFEYYVIALCFSPLYLAMMANFEFGQPLLQSMGSDSIDLRL